MSCRSCWLRGASPSRTTARTLGYDKMQVSMRNTGASTSRSMLNTQYNQFYNTITNRYDRYENNIYYNKTYNSYYTQITNNDIDYNYFITFAPTYTCLLYTSDAADD